MNFKNKSIISILNTNDEDGYLTKNSVSAKITKLIVRAFFDPDFLANSSKTPYKVVIISTKDEKSDKSVRSFIKNLFKTQPLKNGLMTLFKAQSSKSSFMTLFSKFDVSFIQEQELLNTDKDCFSVLSENRNRFLIIHSTEATRKGRSIDSIASFYEDRICSVLGLKKEEKHNVIFVNIRYFFNCDNVSKEIGFSNGISPHLGELIIYRETEDNCYSSVISNNFNRLRKGCGVSSVTLISKDIFKDRVAGDEVLISNNSHYYPRNRAYQIKKDFFDAHEVSDLHHTMLKWMKVHLTVPTAFFSYGTNDKSDPSMQKLSNSMEQYFPNFYIRKDKAIDNIGASLAEITESISRSNIVVFIIGKGFLESQWAMKELLGFIRNKRISGPESQPNSPVENYSKKYGLILLVLDSAHDYIYGNNSKLDDYWNKAVVENKGDGIEGEVCEDVSKNLHRIKHILKDYYTYQDGDRGGHKNFKQIALLIAKYLEYQKLEHPYKYYLDQETKGYFPEIDEH